MRRTADELVGAGADSVSRVVSLRRGVRFWQELFVYFWVFSLIGHYLELYWAFVASAITEQPMFHQIVLSFIPLAAPYGIGVAAEVLIMVPLVKRYRLRPLPVVLSNVFLMGLVEYLSAATIVLVTGHNRFWNYSAVPFNLNGYTALRPAIIFGIAVTLFLYFVYPACDRLIRRIGDRWLTVIFWVLLISYGADLLFYRYR